MAKPGPKSKYENDEERRRARLEAQRRYRLSEKGKAQKKKDDAKYIASEKGKKTRFEAIQKYLATEKGQEMLRRHEESDVAKERYKRYYQSPGGKAISRSNAALRRSKLHNPDLTVEQKEQIKYIYENCPAGHEVDHIMPLSRGGLHTPENLQYLTIRENRQKGAKI